jgi:gas vesicle protein
MKFTRKQRTVRKIAVGSAIAGVAGYLAGVLTAPKSGKDTRKDIVNKAGALKYDAQDQLESAQAELTETLKNAKSKTITMGAQAKAEFNEAVVRAKDAQNKAATVIKAVKAGEAEDPELNKAVKQATQARKNLSKFLKG